MILHLSKLYLIIGLLQNLAVVIRAVSIYLTEVFRLKAIIHNLLSSYINNYVIIIKAMLIINFFFKQL